MVRQVSSDCYEQIKASGLLGELQLKVYTIIRNNGPMTGAEVSKMANKEGSVSETIRNRITELKDYGVVEEVKVDKCPITNRKVIFWGVTNHIPKDKIKRQTKKQKIKRITEGIDNLKEVILSNEINQEWIARQLNRLKNKIMEV